MKNKSLILSLILLFMWVFSPVYAYSYISQTVQISQMQESVIYYAIVNVEGTDNIQADPKKAFDLLKLIDDNEIATFLLAYCYENGVGTEVDIEKSKECLARIENDKIVRKVMALLNSRSSVYPFASKIADFSYDKFGDIEDAYFNLLVSSQFRIHNKERYAEVLKKVEENPEKNANLLYRAYMSSRDFSKFATIIEYIDFDRMSTQDFSEFFNNIANKGNEDLLKKLFANEKFLSNVNVYEKDYTSGFCLYFAFFKKYGIIIEKDEAQADEIIEKFIENFMSLPENQRRYYEFERIGYSPLEGAKDFVYNISTKLKDKGDTRIYIACLQRAWGVEKDVEKAIELNYEIVLKDKSINNSLTVSSIYSIINNFMELYREGKSNKKLEEIAFDTISRTLNNNFSSRFSVSVYYNLLCLGNGDDSDKAKLFKYLEECVEKQNSNNTSAYTRTDKETLAYFYDNGIGTPKDSEKAKAIRLEIEESIKGNASEAYDKYNSLANHYTKNKLYLGGIYAPEMIEYYTKKAASYKLEKDIAGMSAQDKAFMREFCEIFKTFFDKNGKEIMNNKLLLEERKVARAFYERVIEAKSQAIHKMMVYSTPYPNSTHGIGLDSLPFRIVSMPYFERASEYCPKLLEILAYCYANARGCRGDKKIAANYYLKRALYEKEEYQKSSAFYNAYNLYKTFGDYDSMKIILDKRQELGSDRYWDLRKANFYLMESPYRDVEYARVLVEKVRESATDLESYKDIICAQNFDYLELGALQFWAAKKYYESVDVCKFDYALRILIRGYTYGIYCEKDLAKAMEILIEYQKNATENYNCYAMMELIKLMADVEDSDETVFKNTLEALLELRPDSGGLNFAKALAIDKGFAYEKDIAQRDLYLEKAAKNEYLLRVIMREYTIIQPSNDILEKLLALSNLSPSIHYYTLFSTHLRLGNIEEAVKYGKIYDADNSRFGNYSQVNAAHLILKDESPEVTAKRYSKPNQRGQNLIYGSFFYDGYGVEKNRETAFKYIKKVDERWDSRVGDDARIWLWKYYTENNQADLAQALVDPKTKEYTIYNAKNLIVAARQFQDNLDMTFCGMTYNLPRNDEYSNYFLALAEDKYFSDYASDLLFLYGTHKNLANLEKKQEIRKKARAILTQPKPTRKEEVDYKPKKTETSFINVL